MCEKCNKFPATVYMEKFTNGAKSTANLCMHCAAIEHSEVSFGEGFENMLKDVLGNIISNIENMSGVNFILSSGLMDDSDPRCDACGIDMDELREEGKFGCVACYTAFRPQIEHLIQNIHAAKAHVGKTPTNAPREMRLRRDIEELRRNLALAVKNEDYETAAVLRDCVRECENELKIGAVCDEE
ncbi:MAG: UvrB/UvrC motif-containing protein [Defluviitaleaceae bacterium]|nr:UvrB/UvrC motif-containing protein [Defluviitaleaceae bacterium]